MHVISLEALDIDSSSILTLTCANVIIARVQVELNDIALSKASNAFNELKLKL